MCLCNTVVIYHTSRHLSHSSPTLQVHFWLQSTHPSTSTNTLQHNLQHTTHRLSRYSTEIHQTCVPHQTRASDSFLISISDPFDSQSPSLFFATVKAHPTNSPTPILPTIPPTHQACHHHDGPVTYFKTYRAVPIPKASCEAPLPSGNRFESMSGFAHCSVATGHICQFPRAHKLWPVAASILFSFVNQSKTQSGFHHHQFSLPISLG